MYHRGLPPPARAAKRTAGGGLRLEPQRLVLADRLAHDVAMAIAALVAALVLGSGSAATDRDTERTLRRGINGVRQCVLGSKGGVAIVSENVFVLTKRPENTISFSGRRRWVGCNSDVPELVLVRDDQVFRLEELPAGLDLEKFIAVAFKPDKIRIYDFARRNGCHYVRPRAQMPK
jgi:hypothetical protein